MGSGVMSGWKMAYNAFGIIFCSKGVLGENNCMGSIYKLENMNTWFNDPANASRQHEVAEAIQTVSGNQSLSDGEKINAVFNILDPAGQETRDAGAAMQKAEIQAEIDAAQRKGGGRRSKKRPSARRRRSSKARKARSTRRK